jgi:MFS family permease
MPRVGSPLNKRVGVLLDVELHRAGKVDVRYAGRLSDRIGRSSVIGWSRLALAVLVVPGFVLLDTYRSVPMLIIVVVVLSFFVTVQALPAIGMITEVFPRPIRATSLSIVYSIGVAIFGRTAQLIATWLNQLTGSNLPQGVVPGRGDRDFDSSAALAEGDGGQADLSWAPPAARPTCRRFVCLAGTSGMGQVLVINIKRAVQTPQGAARG